MVKIINWTLSPCSLVKAVSYIFKILSNLRHVVVFISRRRPWCWALWMWSKTQSTPSMQLSRTISTRWPLTESHSSQPSVVLSSADQMFTTATYLTTNKIFHFWFTVENLTCASHVGALYHRAGDDVTDISAGLFFFQRHETEASLIFVTPAYWSPY